ncbi:MAG: DNA-3-methyladenine glycosylase [Patescibacteria group bacterium]
MDKALAHLSIHDPVIKRLIDDYPAPTFKKNANYYYELVDSIISQQLSVKAARAIEGRFKDLFGGDYPTPEQIIARDAEEFRAVGLSYGKARYIQDLAQKILDGDVTFDRLDEQSNDEIISELTQVKGIGEWTVHMFLMFCMARLDVLPVGDLGIRNGVTKLYGLDTQATPEDVRSIAEKNNWRPYESVASWYVWQSLENAPNG